MIDAVHGYTYFSEPIAFEMDDGDIKETIRPYEMCIRDRFEHGEFTSFYENA